MKTLSFASLILIFTSFSLQAQNIHIQEDFNAGTLPANWTTTAISGSQSWSIGLNGASVHTGNTNLNGTSFAYFDDDALGGSSLNNHASLTSPVFNNAADSLTILEFDYNARFFSGIPDSFMVEVYDGSNWNIVFQRTTDDCGSFTAPQCRGNFPHALIDISAYKNTNCQVRFRYFDGNDWGWYVGIDNVEVYSPFDHDLSISRIIRPNANCGQSQDSLEVMLVNYGAVSQHNFTLAYQLDLNPVVQYTVLDTLAYLDSMRLTFPNQLNRSVTTSQNLLVYSDLVNDQDRTNDTLAQTLLPFTSTALNYFEDFETANHGWTVSGQNASWAWGVPDTNLSIINSTLSGNSAFVTNLNGLYNNNERSYLTSPCLDFSADTAVPILSFDLIYQTEAFYDFLWLEYSLDGGTSWTKVPTGTYNRNWYTNLTNAYWEDNSNGWKKAINSLNQLAGQSGAKLRFVFESDGSTVLEGVGIDNLFIKSTDSPDLSIDEITYPAIGIRDSGSCQAISSQEIIEAKIINFGSDTIRSFVAAFQISGGSIFRDTIRNLALAPFTDTNFAFITPILFPQNQVSQASVWLEMAGDTIPQNDSLTQLIFDSRPPLNLIQTPFFEDFETVLTPAIPANWTTNTQANFNWRSAINFTLSGNTGPNSSDGHFLYTEASGQTTNRDDALLESPCISLSGLNNYSLSFDYHKHGADMGDLLIDVFDGARWINAVSSINGQTHPNQNNPWLKDSIDLNAYANRTIQLRFRGTYNGGFRGDMAIDNVLLSDTSFIDVGISDANPTTSCYLGPQEQISLIITNYGEENILPNQLGLNYQLNNQALITEFYSDTLKSDSSALFVFSQTADLSTAGQTYNLLLYASLADDARGSNDSIQTQVINQSANFNRSPRITEDFESVSTICHNDLSGSSTLPLNWSYDFNAIHYSWLVQDASLCQFPASAGATETNLTGPSSAHSGNKFLFYEATTTGLNQVKTNCIDPSNMTQLSMEFYYYMYGNGMGKLLIEVEDSVGNIQLVDSVVGSLAFNGQTHFNNSSPWLRKQVVLDSFINQTFKVVFKVVDMQSERSDIALDDVSFYNPLTVKLDEMQKESNTEISIYPNPSQGIYQVRSSENLAGKRYQIFDLKGQLIQEGMFTNRNYQLNLSNSPSGIYFLQINQLGVKEKLVKY